MTSFDLNQLFKVAIPQTQLHSEVLRETTTSYDGGREGGQGHNSAHNSQQQGKGEKGASNAAMER